MERFFWKDFALGYGAAPKAFGSGTKRSGRMERRRNSGTAEQPAAQAETPGFLTCLSYIFAPAITNIFFLSVPMLF